jgi:hypothetical protein
VRGEPQLDIGCQSSRGIASLTEPVVLFQTLFSALHSGVVEARVCSDLYRRRYRSTSVSFLYTNFPELYYDETAHCFVIKNIRIDYKDLSDGGEVRYSSSHPPLVAALHRWFDAQLSDHGADAKKGHAMAPE